MGNFARKFIRSVQRDKEFVVTVVAKLNGTSQEFAVNVTAKSIAEAKPKAIEATRVALIKEFDFAVVQTQRNKTAERLKARAKKAIK